MITIVGFSGSLGAAAIAGVLNASTSRHRLTDGPAGDTRAAHFADGTSSPAGLPSWGW